MSFLSQTSARFGYDICVFLSQFLFPFYPMSSQSPSSLPFGNPWFSVTIGLAGIIVGYTLGGGLPTNLTGPIGDTPTPTVANQPTVPTPQAPAPSNNPPSVDDDPFIGEEDAPVTVIEFTDYQCPFCGRHFTQTFGQIKSTYIDTGKVKYVTRDYPLSFHPFAQKAAEATECAEDQGKFWEMHDKLFANQTALDIPSLKTYAGSLGLNQATFDSCLDGGTHAAEVQKDLADGQAAGISGTPGFWVIGKDGKGEIISGAVPFANFQTAIDRRL